MLFYSRWFMVGKYGNEEKQVATGGTAFVFEHNTLDNILRKVIFFLFY